MRRSFCSSRRLRPSSRLPSPRPPRQRPRLRASRDQQRRERRRRHQLLKAAPRVPPSLRKLGDEGVAQRSPNCSPLGRPGRQRGSQSHSLRVASPRNAPSKGTTRDLGAAVEAEEAKMTVEVIATTQGKPRRRQQRHRAESHFHLRRSRAPANAPGLPPFVHRV